MLKVNFPSFLNFRRKPEEIIFSGLFFYFIAKSLYFALRIRENIFPDESSWLGICQVFSRSFLPPADSPESYSLGLITHIPNLYFFLMGKLLLINRFFLSDLIFLRVANVILGGVTIYFAWQLVCLLASSVWTRLVFTVMLTNTIMFTFITGAVNYDNLSNFCAVISLYYCFRYFKTRSFHDGLIFGIILLAGMLTKNVFLPYGFSLVCVLIFHERHYLVGLLAMNGTSVSVSRGNIVLLCVVSLLLFFNLKLYGGNKIQYGDLIPSMDKVLSIENCLQNRLFARGYCVQQFKKGKMTLVEAQRIALQIRDPGDRAFALNLIDKARQERQKKEMYRMGRLQYSLEWCKYIFTRTYGIAAHLIMEKTPKMLYPYYAVVVLGFFLLLIKFRSWHCEIGYLCFIAFFYIMILMQVVNYNNYISSGFVGLALTGRYLFPVLAPLYFIVVYGLMEKMPRWWQSIVGLGLSTFFIYGDFPWFLQHATSNWYF